MHKNPRRIENVLMTCASDGEIGGVRTVFQDLVRWLENDERKVQLIYPRRLPSIRSIQRANAWGRTSVYCPMPAVVRNSTVLSIGLFLMYAPITLFHLVRLIRRQRIDLINAHFLSPHFLHLVIAARLLRVPLVLSVHGSDVTFQANAGGAHRLLCRAILRRADAVVACSESLARRTSEICPEVSHNITWVHNGMDDTKKPDSFQEGAVSGRFLLCVCRHVHVKGVDVLLKAFAIIHEQVPDVSLVLVGDGPLLSQHKMLADHLSIAQRVVFHGEVAHSDVAGFFANSAVFILPSRSEGFSVTLLEAAYYGVPIVCTNVGGSPELISTGLNGLLVEPNDPAAMASQVLTLLRNPVLARRFGDAARETVRSRFLWRELIRDYVDVYEQCAGASATARLTAQAADVPARESSRDSAVVPTPGFSAIGTKSRNARLPITGKRVTNVLMTCASDGEVGGVQTLFRDLVHWLEITGRRVHLVYPAPLPGLRTVEKINAWGRHASYFAMPASVRNSQVASLLIFLAYAPITFFNLASLIRKEKIDVINCHYLAPYFIHLVIAARLLRVPVVVSVLGSDITSYARAGWAHRFLYRRIVRGADRIVACSEALAKRTADAFPELSAKITWVYCALDDSQHMEIREPADVSRPFVLCVCRHVHVKGVDVLLKAFALMHNDMPEVPLVLVGDGPLVAEHKALAARLGITHRVIFQGETPHSEVPGYLSSCALFVLASRSEGFSITLLEAAYHGRPIICTRVGGSPELISSGINGLLVEPDDPSALAAEMLRVLRNGDLARRLGNAARETVRSRFLWKHRVQDYIDIYEGRPGPTLMDLARPAVPAETQTVAEIDAEAIRKDSTTPSLKYRSGIS
jgi:glycosyltransferase involved in cell wall biosynthesis